jgi:hypothetical protein
MTGCPICMVSSGPRIWRYVAQLEPKSTSSYGSFPSFRPDDFSNITNLSTELRRIAYRERKSSDVVVRRNAGDRIAL